jgi:hypothetical protein
MVGLVGMGAYAAAVTEPDEQLEAKVRKWLTNSGTPFEMHVARAALSRGLDIEQGRYYRDPETEVSREIDVLAGRQIGTAAGTLAVWATIECKFAPTPWVVFRARNATPTAHGTLTG